MRVVVVGGGVAGLSTARGLLAAGHEVVVLERSPVLRASGGALTLWSNGLRALDEFGVDLTGVGREIDTFEAWRSDGRQIWRVDVTSIRRRLGRGAVTIPRQRLVERLAAGLPSPVLRLGREAVAVGTDPHGTTVRCADGSVVGADVVIGADGHRSLVRGQFVGGIATTTGWATWQGLIASDHPIARGAVGVNVIGPGGVAGFLPAGERLLQWWFEVPHSPSESLPPSAVEMLRERFGTWRQPVPEILASVSATQLFPHSRHEVPKVWGGARSTLVGDAAHVMPPALAQGANQSLEDAWFLARALSDDEVTASLRRYESARRRRVAIVSRLAMLATTQQGRRWTRFSGLPSRPTTWFYATALRASSTLLSSRRA
jgi:2-polyprenyl-6-methoxyphenol hydroxylase-like FAD-dependent oxidoreductase